MSAFNIYIPMRPLKLSFDNKIVGECLFLCLSCLLSRRVVQLFMDLECIVHAESVGNVGACAVSMYQALSPPLKGPGYEAKLTHAHTLCNNITSAFCADDHLPIYI